VAALLLWVRRGQLDAAGLRPAPWGFGLVAAAIGMRLVGTYFHYPWFDAVSIMPCLFGLCIVVGGMAALRFAWPALLFLLYMLPLPYRVEMDLGQPLQQLATVASVYALQTLGFAAIAEGNVIHFNDTQIGIVDACSGLRMLVVFFAVATAVAVIVRRGWAQKAAIVASAVPIALLTNVARITVTGIVHDQLRSQALNAFLHDFAGLLMMPVALALLAAELWVLARAVTWETPEQVPVRV